MSTSKYRFSIITPSFNQSEYIERTIRSVLDQDTGFPFEYMVMDGGSTDGTLDILKKYEERLKWFSGPDLGQSDALNRGFNLAGGEIIGWLNSDDVYLQGTLEKVDRLFSQYPEARWLYGRCGMIDENDREIRGPVTLYKNILSARFSYNLLLIENFISQPAVFFRRELLAEVGNLSPDLYFAMDYDLWVRFARLEVPLTTKEYLAMFRLHGTSKSGSQYRGLFREQMEIHKRYDRRLLMLFLHRLAILKTLVAYDLATLLNRIRKR